LVNGVRRAHHNLVVRRRLGTSQPWHADSSMGATIAETRPLSRDEVLLRDEEIAYLIRRARGSRGRNWKLINGRIAAAGVPTAGEGTYGALQSYPLPASETGLVLSATEQGLVPAAHIPIYTPLPINGILSPQAYRWVLTGIFTSVATSGTLTLTNRLGNANTSPSLGASAAQTLTASLTNGQFFIMADVTIRTIGLPGANSTAIGSFHAMFNSAVNGAATTWLWGTGTTAVSFDSTIAAGANGGGVWFGMTFSANFPTVVLQQTHLMDWN
jgi:hypothetical protein